MKDALQDKSIQDDASVAGGKPKGKRREGFMGLFWIFAIIGFWILLQAVVLPKMGVST